MLSRRERRFLLIVLSALSLSTLCTRSQAKAAVDQCRNSTCKDCAAIPTAADCDHTEFPFLDGRYSSPPDKSPAQCRMFCESFSMREFEATSMPSNCTYCQQMEAYERYAISEGDGGDIEPQYCIPRGVCREKCGVEPDGCFYSGTCGSLFCFEGRQANTSVTANPIAHDGPGSILTYNDTSDATVTTGSLPPTEVPEVIVSGHDYCEALDTSFEISAQCPYVDQVFHNPISASFEGNKQCRSACKNFIRFPYEMVRVSTNCDFCNTGGALEFVKYGDGSKSICIPREKCVAECGPEKDGCVYTGSCRSLICLSGMNSKRPAHMEISETRPISWISVDNEGDPVGMDPPVYNPKEVTPRPTPADKDNPGKGSIETLEPDSSDENGAENPMWISMGPILAIAVIAVVVTLLIGVVVRTRNDGDDSSVEAATMPAVAS